MTPAHSGRAEGGFRSAGSPGGAVHGPPIIPPSARGGPATLTARARWGGMRRRQEGGQGGEPQAATQRGIREAAARPPTSPQAAGAPAPTPRGRGDGPPSLRPREEPERGLPPRPSRRLPQEQRGTSEPAPVTPALLPAQGRRRDGTRQSDPPPYRPPPTAQTGGTAHAHPPSQSAPRHTNATGPPHGGRTALSQVGGRPPTTPAVRSPHRACRPRGQCRASTPTRPRPQHVAGGPQQPAQWAGSRGRGSA